MISIRKTDRVSREGENIYELITKYKHNHPIIIDISMPDVIDIFESVLDIIKKEHENGKDNRI